MNMRRLVLGLWMLAVAGTGCATVGAPEVERADEPGESAPAPTTVPGQDGPTALAEASVPDPVRQPDAWPRLEPGSPAGSLATVWNQSAPSAPAGTMSVGRPGHLKIPLVHQLAAATDELIASAVSEPPPTAPTEDERLPDEGAAPAATTVPPTTAPAPPPTEATPPTTTAPATTTTAAPVALAADPSAAGQFASAINSVRAEVGVPALTRIGALDSLAQAWTEQMAASGNFAHSSIINDLVAGEWSIAGENIGYGPSVDAVFGGLRASSDHYTNMVDGRFTSVGVGVVIDPAGVVWTTHLFAG